MKKLVLSIIVATALAGVTALAQGSGDEGLPKGMQAFREYCLSVRNGIESADFEALDDCIAGYDPAVYRQAGKFTYNSTTIELATLEEYKLKEGSQSVDLKGHNRFDPPYVDDYNATHGHPVDIGEPTLVRGFGCYFTQIAIAAKGKCTLVTEGAYDMALFAVAEAGGLLSLVVRDLANNQQFSDLGGKPCVQAVWDMEEYGNIEIELENVTDRDISVIVVTN